MIADNYLKGDCMYIEPNLETCGMLHNSEYNSIYSCLPEQAQQIANLIETIETMPSRGHSFFDLPLSDEEWGLLQLMYPQQEKHTPFYSNLEQIKDTLPNFLEQCCFLPANNSATLAISNIIVKLVSFVLASSSEVDAEVSIRSMNMPEPYCPSPCWHIDKTHAEVIDNHLHSKSLVYILPLVGDATLYYKSSDEFSPHLWKESTFAYEYNETIAFDASKIEYAGPKQGSVHIAGLESGSIHGIPAGGHRFLLVITPSKSRYLAVLKKDFP